MSEATRIRCLLIDDDEASFQLTQTFVEQIPWGEFELEWLATFAEGEEAIARQEHDVYLIDYRLGEGSGIELARNARAQGIHAPMILLTGAGRYEVDVEAMEAGVSDYLDKSKLDADFMERSIRYAMERARAEADLRDSEERQRALFDNLPIGFFRTSVDGDLLDINPALVRLLGHPERNELEFVYARNFFVSPGHRQAFFERLDQFGVIRGFESDLRRPDGRIIRVRCAARAHRAEDGTTLYLEGAVEDISEKLEARDLHGRAARFHWIYQESGLATVILDLDGRIRDANPAFLKRFGYSAGEAIGRFLVDLTDVRDRDGLSADLQAAAAGEGELHESQHRLLAADGEALLTRTRMGLVRSFKGHPDHLMMLLEDAAEG